MICVSFYQLAVFDTVMEDIAVCREEIDQARLLTLMVRVCVLSGWLVG
jgi:hypothetical protein